jgi:hypothetical protein
MGIFKPPSRMNFIDSTQLDLSRLTNALGVELSCLARTSPALLYSMLETAACQESIHDTPTGYLHVRLTLRTLALRLLGHEACQSKATIAAENLLQVSELLTAELQEWNAVFQGFSSLYTQNNMLSQRPLSWIIARFGTVQLCAFLFKWSSTESYQTLPRQ